MKIYNNDKTYQSEGIAYLMTILCRSKCIQTKKNKKYLCKNGDAEQVSCLVKSSCTS